MKENDFYEFSHEAICIIDREKMEKFVDKAQLHSKKKYRFCLHHTPEDSLHEMLIVTTNVDVKYPDKHMFTSESNIILEGRLLVILFSENGNIVNAFVLDKNDKFYYRCEKDQYHMTIPLSDVAVYIEIKEGPFNDRANVYPKWAPSREDIDEMREFQQKVKKEAMKYL